MDQSKAREGKSSENASESLPPSHQERKRRQKINALKKRLNY